MRYDDWQDRFFSAIETARLVPFVWGVHDCALFAGYVIDSISDRGVLAQIQAKYSWTSAVEAYSLIDAQGGLTAFISQFLGPPMDNKWFAGQGDVVIAVNGDGREVIMVHDGVKLIGPADPDGLEFLPTSEITVAWRV